MTPRPPNRRLALKTVAVATAAIAVSKAARGAPAKVRQGRVQQSVVPWCFRPMPARELIEHSAKLGLKSVELVGTEHWALLKEKGLICAITGSHGFARGFAHKEEHEECIAALRKSIDATSAAGWPNVITFSGFRRGLSDEEGIKNMVEGLKKIIGHAEQKRVTLCLEMLNSRVDVEMKGHPDYFCDSIERSIEIIKQVGSERMKLLFDIYHVQIMHGDVIARIRQYHPYIAHYHTAGVPGRAEIDNSQELNYPAIMKAIVETGYKGYVGQEFIPTRDKVEALREAVGICDV
jgi:hydroxypyruvate isomerase